jgi:hypothetical protein
VLNTFGNITTTEQKGTPASAVGAARMTKGFLSGLNLAIVPARAKFQMHWISSMSLWH